MNLYLIENQLHNKKYVIATNLKNAIKKFEETFKNTDDDYEIISAMIISNDIIIGE